MKIPTHPVTSSSLKEIGYDPKTKTLALIFKSKNARYHYENVPEEKHRELMAAPSHGQYVMRHILPHHKHTKIE